MSLIAKHPPLPQAKIETNVWTSPFWEAAARHELVASRCGNCGTFRMPPTPFCPACQSQQIDWMALPGTGTVYSYTVVSRAIFPGMEDALPYVPAIITLDGGDGVRLISNVVESPIDAIAIDARVSLFWHDLPDGGSLPQFRIISDR